MGRRELIASAVLALPAVAVASPVHAQADDPGLPALIQDVLQSYLVRHGLPALAAAVVRDGQIVAAGAVGTRRAGTESPVGVNDRFHIGSDTKAVTSLLAGILVEAGALRWDSNLGAVFPDLASGMDEGLQAVTLEQLLSHTGGLAADNDAFRQLLAESLLQGGLNLDELRYWLLRRCSHQPLTFRAGTTFAYSNLGYTLAGAMLERVTQRTWEELAVQCVFEPLGLRTAGFGPQATLGRVDAPLGHLVRLDGTLKPMLAGPWADNAPVIGPAAAIHMSILDFANWAGWHASEGRRGPALVQPETLRKLHAPVVAMPGPDAATAAMAASYGLGWVTATTPYTHEPFLTHSGSNTMNRATIMLQPARQFGMVMATNVGGEVAEAALRALGSDLHGRFGHD